MRNVTILLAVVAMFALASQAEVTLYEGFDYTAVGDDLHGKGGTTESGFATGSTWLRSTTHTTQYEADIKAGSLSCGAYTLSSSGNSIGSTGGTGGGAYNKRQLSAANTVNLDVDSVVYASAIFKIGTHNNVTLDFGDFDDVAGSTIFFRIYGGSGGYINTHINGQDGWYDTPGEVAGSTWFAVMKIETSATGSDTVSMNIYGSDAPPATEPTTWDCSKSSAVTGTISMMSITMGSGTDHGMDEIRMGTTWGDVAVPEPATMVLLGIGGIGVLIRRRRK